MRRLPAVLLLVAFLLGLVASSAAPAGGQGAEGTACTGGEAEILSTVRDAATGQRLPETANVEFHELDGTPIDDANPIGASRYRYCAPVADGDLKIRFDGDSYRQEWWNDQPNLASANVIDIPGVDDPIIANAASAPNGRVIAGRVTNMGGVPKFASVGIYRRNAAGNWVGIDGIGNSLGNGWYSYQVPSYGRYRVNACVDFHWCQWATSEDRLRFARVIVVAPGDASTFVNNVHIRVPYCHAAPDFCVPPGFGT